MSKRRNERPPGPSGPRRRKLVEALEPRILLAADLAAGLLDEALVPTAATQQELVLDGPEASLESEVHARRELVFLDAGLEDPDQLVADLLAGREDDAAQVTVVMLDAERDGLTQISEVLAASDGRFDAVHVVSHGTESGMQLGSTWLDAESLTSRAGELSGWRDGFTQEGDLLLYGCDLAATQEGQTLVDDLALLTGADVAASVDLTGALAKGGDWDLEYAAGEVETDVVFSHNLQLGYQHVLGGTAIWAEVGSSVPETADFDGTSFGSEGATAAVSGEWRVLSGISSETRDEKIVTGIDETGKLSTLRWDGTSWNHDGTWAWPMSDPTDHGLDLAYESQSGDAMLVFNDGLGGLGYTVWDGSSWTPVANVPQAEAGEASHIKLAADPHSDEIIVIVSNEYQEDYTAVWDGSSWGNAIDLHNSGNPVGHTDVNVVYEQQSGDAMLVWGENDDRIHYRIWNGTSFSSEMTLDPPAGVNGDVAWTAVAADPNSDRIALAVGTDNGGLGAQDAWLAVWDGSAWNAPVKTATDTPHGDRQAVAVAFESTTGQALAAYATGGDIAYQTWTPGGGWSGELVGPDVGGHPDTVVLDAEPGTDRIMLSVVDQGKDVSFTLWDGSSWGTPSVQETDAGTNQGQPFLFLWDRAASTTPEVSASGAATVNVGDPYALNLSASNVDIATLSWTIDWGDGVVETISGNPSSATHTYTNAGFTNNILVSASDVNGTYMVGDLLTTSMQTGSVMRFDAATGAFLQEFGVGDVSSPIDVQVGPDGGIYVTGFGTDNIYRYDADGSNGTEFVTAGSGGLNAPSRIAFGPDGNLYVTSMFSNEVLRFSGENGSPLGAFVSSGLDSPDGITFGPDGHLYVANRGSGEIHRYDGVTGVRDMSFLANTSTGYMDIVFGPDGQLWVTNQSSDNIERYDATTGADLGEWTDIGASDFAGIAFAPDGYVYMSDAMTVDDKIVRYRIADGGTTSEDFITKGSEGLNQPVNIVFTPAQQVRVNAPPTAVADSASVAEGASIVIDVAANDTDPEAALDLASITIVTGPAHGTLVDNGDGTLTYTHDGSPTPADSFSYAIDDDAGATSNAATVSIAVGPVSTASLWFSTENDVNGSGAPGLESWDDGSIVAFDPTSLGGTTSGSFSKIFDLDALAADGDADVDALHYVRSAITVGGANAIELLPGDLLLSTSADETLLGTTVLDGDVVVFRPTSSDYSSGHVFTLLDIGAVGDVKGIALVEEDTTIGGVDLTAGSFLYRSEGNGDVLHFTADDVGAGTTAGTSSVLIDASAIGLTLGYISDFTLISSPTSIGGAVLSPGQLLISTSWYDTVGGIVTNAHQIIALDVTTAGPGTVATASVLFDGPQVGIDSGDEKIFPFTLTGDVNTAPVLTPAAPTLPNLLEGASGGTGETIDSILGTSVTDDDPGAHTGLAITDLDSGSGTWEYSIDGGAQWDAVGTASNTNALLLRGTDLIRFVPAPSGSDTATFSFRAWDQTLGEKGTRFDVSLNGGTTAFSANTDVGTVDVLEVNEAPTATDQTFDVDEDGVRTLALADFGYADPDGDSLLNVIIGSVPGAGVLRDGATVLTGGETISAASITAGQLTFTPVADANGDDYASFTFRVQDDGGTANGGVDLSVAPNTLTFDVTAVNDAPAGTDKSLAIDEDGSHVFTLADFGFSDALDGDSLLAVRITSVVGGGTLTDGVTVLTGGETVTAASVLAGDLVFTPVAEENGSGYASLTFQVQDDGGTLGSGVDLDPTPNTIIIDVTSVSDAPEGTDKVISVVEDDSHVLSLADFGFSDDAEGDAFQNIVIGTISGGGMLTSGVSVLTGGETISAAAIAGGGLVFTPAPDQNGAGYASFTFQVQDDGGPVGGGSDLDASANTIQFDVTAQNDAPSGSDGLVNVAEDDAYTFSLTDFGYGDLLEGDAFAELVIGTVSGSGTLTNGATVLSGGETVTAAELTAGDLVFTPVSDENGAAYASFTFQVRDDGGTANGGVDLDPTANSITVGVMSVNDAPQGNDLTIDVDEDATQVLTLADFGFSDPVEGDAFLAIEIGSVSGGGILRDGATTLTGGETVTAAAIQAGSLTFTPTPGESGAGYASFGFQVQDDGGTANGGVDEDPTANLITFDVTALNDAPDGADRTVSLLEDGSHAFTLADFGFDDGGEGDALLEVVLGALSGSGTLRDGATVLTGGETVSAASIAAGDLVFTPADDANGLAYASFQFQVRDDGGTAGGGVDLDPVANLMTLDVAAVNDEPSGTDQTVVTGEDTPYVFTVSDFGLVDALDGDDLASVVIGSISGSGTLREGVTVLTGGETISAASITAGSLIFTPGSGDNGASYASFTFQVQDDGGTAGGGVDLDSTPNTLTVDVSAVNNAPSGADTTVATPEGVARVFTLSDFGFTDPADGHLLQSIDIGVVSGSGTLRQAGVALTGGETVSAGSIAAGELVFTPAGDDHGAGYASFTFQVRDSGGTANGGVDLDPTANTVTIDVAAVNDAPSGADKTLSVLEDGSRAITLTDLGFTDAVEGHGLDSIVIDSVPSSGTLRDGATILTGGESVTVASIAAGDLVFTPVVNENGTGYAAFRFLVRDDGGTANGGVDLDPTANTIQFDVTPLNDAPSGADGTVVTLEDQPYTFQVADFGFTDAVEGDALSEVLIGSVSGAGTLRNGVTVLTGGETVTVADITAGQLVFTPQGETSGADHGRFTFRVRDDGGTPNGGLDLDPTLRTLQVDVSSVNDAPSGSDRTVLTDEDSSHVFSLADFGFSDLKDGDALLDVTVLGLTGGGALYDGGTDVSGGGVVTAASIAAGNLVFVPASGESGTAYASFDFQVRDDGGTANGGVADDPTPNTITIDVARENDAPSGTDKTVGVLEDGSHTITLAEFGFSDGVDGDAFASVEIVTVSGGGTLRNGATVLTGGETVTAAEILAGDLVFTPTPGANGAAHGSFTFQVRDDGGTLLGVDLDPSPNAFVFDVVAVNDAPDGADRTVVTAENQSYTFTVADFGFDDGVEGDGFKNVLITSLTGGGTLRNAGTALTGGETVSVADIVAGKLVLAPTPGASGAGHAGFSFQVSDDGGVANGGVDLDPTPAIMTLDVTAVNDAPSGSDATLTVLEDATLTITLADLGFSDAEGDGLLDVLITGIGGTGTLRDGATILTGGETVTAASITAGNLTFTPVGDTYGAAAASFDFQVRDDGGVVVGGVDLDPSANTITIDVTGVNDAPSGTDRTVGLAEDETYVFGISDFGFVDPLDGHLIKNVKITTAPGAGTLRNGAIVLTGGETVSRASINAGDLTFTPDPDASGAGYASFQFQVRDRGGKANGGVNLDPTPNTMTIDVAAANDAPQLAASNPSLSPLTEDQTTNGGASVATIVAGSITDVDPSASQGIAVTQLSAGAGHFEYSTDGGTSWSSVGSVSSASALLLGESDRIRFVPDAQNGQVASLDYRAWDRTSGIAATRVDTSMNGGSSAFSTGVDQVSVNVSSLNDAPSVGDATFDASASNGATVDALFAGSFSDVDTGSSLQGVAVVEYVDAPSQGVWQYSSDGGTHWADIGTVADGPTALALDAGSRLRFVGSSGYAGDTPDLHVRALDDSHTGGFSSTAAGTEVRKLVDTTSAGGTSSISAAMAHIQGTVQAPPPTPSVVEPTASDEPDFEGLGSEIAAIEDEVADGAEEPQQDSSDPVATTDPVATATDEPGDGDFADLETATPGPVALGLVAPSLPHVSSGLGLGPTTSDAPREASAQPFGHLDEERRDAPVASALDRLTAGPKAQLRDMFGGFDLNPDFLLGDSDFLRELDRLRDVALGQDAGLEGAVVGSSAALSAGLSIGYVIWLTRGGLLIASLASSIPVWRLVDPIPVLASLAMTTDDEEAESLNSLVQDRAERDAEAERAQR